MTRPPPRRAPTFLLLVALVGPAAADVLGSATSSASSAASAGSASLGSVSDSIRGSSQSSSRETQVAEGVYRVAAVEPVTGGEEPRLRLTLRPEADGAAPAFDLELPARALAVRPLAVGQRVQARARAYGVEFAHADTRAPFFLVLADAWYRELGARAL